MKKILIIFAMLYLFLWVSLTNAKYIAYNDEFYILMDKLLVEKIDNKILKDNFNLENIIKYNFFLKEFYFKTSQKCNINLENNIFSFWTQFYCSFMDWTIFNKIVDFEINWNKYNKIKDLLSLIEDNNTYRYIWHNYDWNIVIYDIVNNKLLLIDDKIIDSYKLWEECNNLNIWKINIQNKLEITCFINNDLDFDKKYIIEDHKIIKKENL